MRRSLGVVALPTCLFSIVACQTDSGRDQPNSGDRSPSNSIRQADASVISERDSTVGLTTQVSATAEFDATRDRDAAMAERDDRSNDRPDVTSDVSGMQTTTTALSDASADSANVFETGAELGGTSTSTSTATLDSGTDVTSRPPNHCSPGTVVYPVLESCGIGESYIRRLPGFDSVGSDALLLPEPLAPGVPFALSKQDFGPSEGTLEIWGAMGDCSVAETLLWVGTALDATFCAEFIPDKAYTHLILATRGLRYNTEQLLICPTGQCAEDSPGESRSDGHELSATIGVYPAKPSYKIVGDDEGDLMLPFTHERAGYFWGTAQDSIIAAHVRNELLVSPIVAGLLTMPETDPFGDGVYCPGAGSIITYEDPEDIDLDTTIELSFENLTRLVPYSASGTESLVLSSDLETTIITTSYSSLPAVFEQGGPAACSDEWCFVSLGTQYEPRLKLLFQTDRNSTAATSSIYRAILMYRQSAEQEFQVAVGQSGTMTRDSTNHLYTFEVEQLTAFSSCPGESVTPSELRLNFREDSLF